MPSPKRVPTALVLALSSTMVSIGAAFWLAPCSGTDPEPAPPAVRADILLTTPERASESFVDAWRRRDHEGARQASTGAARARVEERASTDAAMSADEVELKRQVWDLLARERLELVLEESETLEGGDLALSGRLVGSFAGRPYEREVRFEVTGEGNRFLVSSFEFGRVLTETPFDFDIE